MNSLIIQVTAVEFYGGHNVKINGVQVAHRPYDGSHSDVVEREVAEAFGAILRDKTEWSKEAAPEEEDDW